MVWNIKTARNAYSFVRTVINYFYPGDEYAQERGGWSSDRVMKCVYTHTFSDERKKVDETIDNYFETLLGVKKDPETLSPEEAVRRLQEANPEGWQQVLQELLKHLPPTAEADRYNTK